MSKAIVITSGGMDSATAVYWTRDNHDPDPVLLSFNYGQRHVKELDYAILMAERLGLDHRIIDLTSLSDSIDTTALLDKGQEVPEGHYSDETMKATVVPNRNMMMLSIAGAVAVAEKAEMIVIGVHAGDHAVYPDCRPKFIQAVNRCLYVATEGFGHERLRVVAPFLYATKAEIAHVGESHGVPWHETWSCYKGGNIHCGRCSTCVERLEAFDEAGVRDLTEYADTEFWRTVVAASD